MALDTASEGNLNTKNPEKDMRLIENLASINSTKNTDFERRKVAASLGKEQLIDVKAKLACVLKHHQPEHKVWNFKHTCEEVWDLGGSDKISC